MHSPMISVEVEIAGTREKIWECWTRPEHITRWNFAIDAWCCPWATNDLRPGGEFTWRMETKDGSLGFDFTGTYTLVEEGKFITYSLADGRKVEIRFTEADGVFKVIESFEPVGRHSEELQRTGWQAILASFKKYVESL